jgi:hypothetical protein
VTIGVKRRPSSTADRTAPLDHSRGSSDAPSGLFGALVAEGGAWGEGGEGDAVRVDKAESKRDERREKGKGKEEKRKIEERRGWASIGVATNLLTSVNAEL